MTKQVQIDEDLFISLYYYFFSEEEPSDYEIEEIRRKMSEKIDKLISRELFTKYKRLPTGAERETARREYLEHKGILTSFRTDTEQNPFSIAPNVG